MLQVSTSLTSLVPSLGIKHKHFVITEPKATSNPPVTHQPLSLHKQWVQQCRPSLAQSPAVSAVLSHTPGTSWTGCSLLHSIASRDPHPVPHPLQNPAPTIHGHLGRGGSHRRDAPAVLGRNQNPLVSQLLACIWLSSGCPTPHGLLAGNAIALSASRRNTRAAQTMASRPYSTGRMELMKEEDPSPIPNHTKTTITGLSLLQIQWTIQKVYVELI